MSYHKEGERGGKEHGGEKYAEKQGVMKPQVSSPEAAVHRLSCKSPPGQIKSRE